MHPSGENQNFLIGELAQGRNSSVSYLQAVWIVWLMRKNQRRFKIRSFVHLFSRIKMYSNEGKHAPFPALLKQGE
jgi:hypothetical protein